MKAKISFNTGRASLPIKYDKYSIHDGLIWFQDRPASGGLRYVATVNLKDVSVIEWDVQ